MSVRKTSLLLVSVGAMCLTAAPFAQAGSESVKVFAPNGYTIIALGTNGKSDSAEGGKKVALKVKAARITLHLVSRKGVYAAPVVAAPISSTKVAMGIKTGTDVGKLKINTKTGTARPAKALKSNDVVKSITAKAKKGIPIGAKNKFGLVESKATGTSKAGTDADRDGIPGAFDIDNDGDLVLNNIEGSSTGTHSVLADPPPAGAAPGGPPPGASSSGFRVFSNFKLNIEQTLNANAGVTDAQINETMKKSQTLAIQVQSGTVELNCTGLSYCSAGGTGQDLSSGSFSSPVAFPACCDSDGDGFGTLTAGSTNDFQLLTGATSSQIGSGDTMIQMMVDSSGTVTELPGTLNFAFVTTPGLTSWSSGSNSGTVSYPVASGAQGTQGNPFPVAASGDVSAKLTFWRPQRSAIPAAGEGTGYIDIGGLTFTADIPNGPTSGGPGPGSSGPGNCAASNYSTSDPNLNLAAEGVEDQATDQPSNAANTLTFTINLTGCLGSTGWTSGQTLNVDIQARTKDGDNAAQKIAFKRA